MFRRVLFRSVIVAMVVTSKKGAMKLKKKAAEEDAQEVVLIENSQVNDEANAEPQGLPVQGLEDSTGEDITPSDVD